MSLINWIVTVNKWLQQVFTFLHCTCPDYASLKLAQCNQQYQILARAM